MVAMNEKEIKDELKRLNQLIIDMKEEFNNLFRALEIRTDDTFRDLEIHQEKLQKEIEKIKYNIKELKDSNKFLK
ncbi:MAG: hypothetical protein QXU98_12700 [Candidatus Parvarchaeota archaeon]